MKPSITRLSTAVLISSMVLSTIVPTQSHAATYEGTVNTSILNVRSSTSTTSSIVGKLTQGTTVQVYSTSNSWATINFQGQKRYVSSSYLTLKPTVTKTSTSQTYKAEANVNMRSSMTTTAPVVITIPKGATVTYVSTHGASGSWLKVTYNGKTGYVAQRYFSLTGGQLVTSQSNTSHTTINSTTMHSSMVSTSPVLVTIPKGAKVVFISEHGATGSWAKVTYAGKTGFVAKRNLQPIVTVEPTTLYVKSKASIFSAMSTSGKSIGTAPVGASVKLLSKHGATGSWARITYNSVTGYVPMRNLTESKIVETVTPYYAQRAATMYSSTSTTSNVLDSIPSGAKVDQLSAHGATGSWFKIRYNGKTGYVAARSFSLTPPSTSTEQYGPEREVRVVVANNGTLNVRDKATTSGKELGKLSSGTIVKIKPVLGTSWGILTSGTFSGGYIHLDYTQPITTTTPSPGIKRVVSYTNYPYTLQTMINRQVAVTPQTDKYRNSVAYIPRAWLSISGSTGKIVNNNATTIRSVSLQKNATSTSSEVITTIPTGSSLQYLERPSATSAWYKVKYGTLTGYIPATAVVGEAKVYEKASMSSHVYGQINPGETVKIVGTSGNYYTVSYSRPSGQDRKIFDNLWRTATASDVSANVNPNNFNLTSKEYFQFLDLTKSADTSASVLNKSLLGKGILSGKGQAFIDAGNLHKINELYLISHALLETGNGTSSLAKGTLVTSVDGKSVTPMLVYNMFGIGAIDSNPHVKGAERAYKEGWFTPEAAIIGGAKFIAGDYVYKRNQNTLYKMRFNPDAPGSYQYATDIGWAVKQTNSFYNLYQTLDSYTLYFDVPKFQ